MNDLYASWKATAPPVHITAAIIAQALGAKLGDGSSRPTSAPISVDQNPDAFLAEIGPMPQRIYDRPALAIPIVKELP